MKTGVESRLPWIRHHSVLVALAGPLASCGGAEAQEGDRQMLRPTPVVDETCRTVSDGAIEVPVPEGVVVSITVRREGVSARGRVTLVGLVDEGTVTIDVDDGGDTVRARLLPGRYDVFFDAWNAPSSPEVPVLRNVPLMADGPLVVDVPGTRTLTVKLTVDGRPSTTGYVEAWPTGFPLDARRLRRFEKVAAAQYRQSLPRGRYDLLFTECIADCTGATAASRVTVATGVIVDEDHEVILDVPTLRLDGQVESDLRALGRAAPNRLHFRGVDGRASAAIDLAPDGTFVGRIAQGTWDVYLGAVDGPVLRNAVFDRDQTLRLEARHDVGVPRWRELPWLIAPHAGRGVYDQPPDPTSYEDWAFRVPEVVGLRRADAIDSSWWWESCPRPSEQDCGAAPLALARGRYELEYGTESAVFATPPPCWHADFVVQDGLVAAEDGVYLDLAAYPVAVEVQTHEAPRLRNTDGSDEQAPYTRRRPYTLRWSSLADEADDAETPGDRPRVEVRAYSAGTCGPREHVLLYLPAGRYAVDFVEATKSFPAEKIVIADAWRVGTVEVSGKEASSVVIDLAAADLALQPTLAGHPVDPKLGTLALGGPAGPLWLAPSGEARPTLPGRYDVYWSFRQAPLPSPESGSIPHNVGARLGCINVQLPRG